MTNLIPTPGGQGYMLAQILAQQGGKALQQPIETHTEGLGALAQQLTGAYLSKQAVNKHQQLGQDALASLMSGPGASFDPRMAGLIQSLAPDDPRLALQIAAEHLGTLMSGETAAGVSELEHTRAVEIANINAGKPPAGYRRTDTDELAYIPGGPADPKQQLLPQGTEVSAWATRTLPALAPIIKSGDATQAQQDAYALAYRSLMRPTMIGSPETGFQSVPAQPLDPKRFPPVAGGEQDVPSLLSKTYRTQVRKLDQVDQSLGAYERLLERTGAEIMFGPERKALKGAYTDVLLELKELYNLGVIAGPDLDLMHDRLTDPTSLSAKALEMMFGAGKTFRPQMEQIRAKLGETRASVERNFGPQGQLGARQPSARTPAGANVAPDQTAPVQAGMAGGTLSALGQSVTIRGKNYSMQDIEATASKYGTTPEAVIEQLKARHLEAE